MADMDPEMAFLEAQSKEQEYDPAADFSHLANQPEEAEDDDEYDPDNAFAAAAHSPSVQSASMPQSTVNTPPVVEGALKPQPADAAAAAPTPSKQVRTKGGFVDDSEDDEADGPVTVSKASAVLSNTGAPGSPQRSVTLSPNNTTAQQTMPSSSAQDQALPGVSSSVAVPEISVAASVPSGGTPVPDSTKTALPNHVEVASARQSAAPATPVSASLPKARLPQDRVGLLEDRIADDPRGDIEAWLGLIEEHRRRHKHDDARAVFERFFKVFPSAGEQWVEYVNMETELDNFKLVEQLFGRSLTQTPHIALWSSYINYIRRIHNLTTDTSGQARGIITQVYEFVLDNMGIDISAGRIWLDYIELLKTGPGVLGGNSWQDMQKMDSLRKAYQRAIAVPTNSTLDIWREYDKFEMNLNKVTGRKHLQEKSASYMTARSAVTVLLDNITKGVNRTTLPKLPPAPGFDGAEEYKRQVQAWKNWIEWEKNDPLDIKDDDRALYNKRVLYLYKNALMALRFWPELWYDAAEWCYQNDLSNDGDEFLKNGTAANPESCLLAFKQSIQAELRTNFEDGEAGLIAKGKAVRAPLDTVLDALYELTNKAKKREEQTVAKAKEIFAAQQAAEDAARASSDNMDDEDDDEASEAAKRQKMRQDALDAQLQGITKASNAEIHTLKKTLSYAWIALMRAMRRVQGKGSPGADVGGFRGVFAQARKKGKLLSDTYVASALIEHHCYQDPAANKIFERGMRLFPDDEEFALEYIKHLVKLNDSTNARAVFETIVNRLTQKPENVHRAKPLFTYFHNYESQFGEQAQITKIEQRMATYFPEDPQLLRFSSRFASTSFDPTAMRPIISPRTQMRPVMPAGVMPTVEEPHPPMPSQNLIPQERVASPALVNSPRLGHLMPAVNSPKRPLEDAEIEQPRKMARGESPIKGAAGRRLDAARRSQMASGNTPVAGPTPLPRMVNFCLTIIPPAYTYGDTTRFNPEAMVQLLRNTYIPSQDGLNTQQPAAPGPPSAHINSQLQNIQARFGPPAGWS